MGTDWCLATQGPERSVEYMMPVETPDGQGTHYEFRT